MTRPTVDPNSQTAAFRQGELRLLDVIGSGGFGTVYRAEIVGEMGFRKAVAVKVLSEEGQTDTEIVGRLRDEARILGLLHHRAIVGVDDLLRVDGRWAVVMELVEGLDLSRLIEDGPMPPRVVAEICREACLALSAAHTACHPDTGQHLQVIHRDIKPANIKVTSAGEIKVLDFGVARARFASREAETRAIRFGSPGYIAPERFDGEDSAASDIYSLGAVLMECLLGEQLGRLPMSRSQHPIAVQKALARTGCADTELGAIATQMLAYEPEDRPSAGECARRLRVAALSGDGPWLSEWAPAALASLRGDTVPRLPPASADTLDLPEMATPWMEPLPPPTSEEDRPAQLATPPLPERAPKSIGAPPVFEPVSGPFGASITYDEPALGPFIGAAQSGEPSLGLTGPLPERPIDDEVPVVPRGVNKLALGAVALLALLGVGGWLAFAPSSNGGPEVVSLTEPQLNGVEPLAPSEDPATPSEDPATPAAAATGPEVGTPATTAAPPRTGGEATAKPPATVASPSKGEAVASGGSAATPHGVAPVKNAGSTGSSSVDGPKPATPEVKPELAAPPTESVAPPPAPRGTVVVTGAVDELVLFSADGARHRPGRLDAGHYEVAWRFGEGELVRAGVTVDVAEGQVVTLFCGASTGSCRVLK